MWEHETSLAAIQIRTPIATEAHEQFDAKLSFIGRFRISGKEAAHAQQKNEMEERSANRVVALLSLTTIPYTKVVI